MLKEAMKCSSLSLDIHDYTLQGLPDIRIVPNALYLPKNPGHGEGYFGIFDKYGRLVNECSMFWHKKNILSSHPRETKISHLWDYPEIDSAVYCGHVSLHYGHVLLDFLSRLWFLNENVLVPKKILIHSEFSKKEILETKWFNEILQLTKIDPENILLFDTPIKIKKLFAPNPGCEADSYVYKGFIDFCHKIGEFALSGMNKIDYPVYLSRRKLLSGTKCFSNENFIVDYLERKGVKEVFPEELSLKEQISLFSGKYPIIGTCGSSFHTSIFSKNPVGVAINFSSQLTESFFAIDRANDADIDYLYPRNSHEVSPSVNGFPKTIEIDNPYEFMREVFDIWEKKKYSPDLKKIKT